jgi:TrfA protein
MAELKSYIDGTRAVVDPEEMRDPELRELVEKLGNAMVRAQQDTAVEKRTAQIIQFPLFPEEKRPVSNDVARSALFSCVQGKDRQMFENALLATVEGMEIRFTGRQFNQDDHDVLMQLVYMAAHKPLGEYVMVPANAILKALGRKIGKSQHKQLEGEITRLVSGTVIVRQKGIGKYIGHLVDNAFKDDITRRWRYRFNPDLRALYGPHTYTLINWEQRITLRGKDLARWLHLYLVGHAAPFPVKVAKLKQLSGSRAKELKNFRGKLRLALNDLKDTHIIDDWIIDINDLVHVKRGEAISESQKRHLLRQ